MDEAAPEVILQGPDYEDTTLTAIPDEANEVPALTITSQEVTEAAPIALIMGRDRTISD